MNVIGFLKVSLNSPQTDKRLCGFWKAQDKSVEKNVTENLVFHIPKQVIALFCVRIWQIRSTENSSATILIICSLHFKQKLYSFACSTFTKVGFFLVQDYKFNRISNWALGTSTQIKNKYNAEFNIHIPHMRCEVSKAITRQTLTLNTCASDYCFTFTFTTSKPSRYNVYQDHIQKQHRTWLLLFQTDTNVHANKV